MPERTTVSEILKTGIKREIESQRLYSELGGRVKEASAKYAFSELVQHEKRHQEILEQYLSGGIAEGTLELKHVVDYHIAQHMEGPKITAEMALPEIFLLAANREKLANEFYAGLAALHPQGETRRLLEKLASEELGHKLKVETIYTEVAYPQTDGG